MKATIIKITLVLLVFSTCQKPIDELSPNNLLTEDNAFTNADKIESLLGGVYQKWLSFNFGRLSMLVNAYSGITKYRFLSEAPLSFNTNQVFFDNEELNSGYPKFYLVTGAANHLIRALQSPIEIENLDAVRRKEVEAEARVSRALMHFFILRLFGEFWDLNSEYGVAIELIPTKENKPPERSTVQETYDSILSDLDFGIANGPTSKSNRYRAFGITQATAKGIKAKVLLYMQDYSGAAQLAKEVMDGGYFILEENYETIFANAYLSREFLYAPSTVFSLVESNLTYTDFLKELADKQVGTATDGDLTSGEGFDPRFSMTYVKAKFPKSSPLLSSTFGNIRNGKYPHKKGSRSNFESVLRMGEIYLIYAEAKARLGSNVDTEALNTLNKIRSRAGVDPVAPTSKAALIEAIRIEKTLELFHEWAEPWYDMVRYHKLGDINIKDHRPTIINDTQLILPIPEKALEANKKLKQNPGY